jgi:Fe-S-cluster-containing hydrogenase component 2
MRSINEFSAPGMCAPPHFRPKLDAARCISCGLCARRCPMGALLVDTTKPRPEEEKGSEPEKGEPEKGAGAFCAQHPSGRSGKRLLTPFPGPADAESDPDPFPTARPLAAGHERVKYLAQRCIGCGQCVLACQQQHALSMDAVADHKLPYRSWFSMIARSLPGMLKTSWQISRSRKNQK